LWNTVNKTVGLYLLDKERKCVNTGFWIPASAGMTGGGERMFSMRFIVDSMLGRLATWLRVLGYDTYYQSAYREGELAGRMLQGRHLVTRDRTRWQRSGNVVFLESDQVGAQLKELFAFLQLPPDPSRWFTRCLRCNAVLEPAAEEEAMEKVPEYVFYESGGRIKVCRSCGRYYWPGSHRTRMLRQLAVWGFARENGSYDLT